MLKGENLFSPQSITKTKTTTKRMIYRKKIEQKRKKISLKPCEWMNGHLGFQEETP